LFVFTLSNLFISSFSVSKLNMRNCVQTGYIYCLTNPCISNIYKIGSTKKDPQIRALQLSAPTGVPRPYTVLFAKKVDDYIEKERIMHKLFDNYRVNAKREFFQMPVEKIRLAFELTEGEWWNQTETTKNDSIWPNTKDEIIYP